MTSFQECVCQTYSFRHSVKRKTDILKQKIKDLPFMTRASSSCCSSSPFSLWTPSSHQNSVTELFSKTFKRSDLFCSSNKINCDARSLSRCFFDFDCCWSLTTMSCSKHMCPLTSNYKCTSNSTSLRSILSGSSRFVMTPVSEPFFQDNKTVKKIHNLSLKGRCCIIGL